MIVILNGHINLKNGDYANVCKESIRKYATLHNYKFYSENPLNFKGDLSKVHHLHYWRCEIAQSAAKEFPEADWYVWLDSDVFVNSKMAYLRIEDVISLDSDILYYTTHEKPFGCDEINTGFKIINKKALKYEKEMWDSKDISPWNEFAFEQKALRLKIFPQINKKYVILNNEVLNCWTHNSLDIQEKALFIHMCALTTDERNNLVIKNIKNKFLFI